MEPGVKPLFFGWNTLVLSHKATNGASSHTDISLRSLACWNRDPKDSFLKLGFPHLVFTWEILNYSQRSWNGLHGTEMSLALSLQICSGPHHERKTRDSQAYPIVSAHRMSCRLRDFSSLWDTMDVVRLGNNDLSLPLSKGERRQWLVTNMVQSLPDHIKRHHRASHIPDAFLVIGRDTKWCLSYNGQGWDCENSCHATCQLPSWGLSH